MEKGCRHYASFGLVLGCLQLSPTFFRLQVVIDINRACPRWLQFLGFISRIIMAFDQCLNMARNGQF